MSNRQGLSDITIKPSLLSDDNDDCRLLHFEVEPGMDKATTAVLLVLVPSNALSVMFAVLDDEDVPGPETNNNAQHDASLIPQTGFSRVQYSTEDAGCAGARVLGTTIH
jgi:hypothetical protein